MNINNFSKFNIKNMISKEINKNLTKFILANKYKILKSDKILRMAYRNKYFFKHSSISFFKRSCLKQGNCKSVFKFFKMSRFMCRFYASNGFLYGLRKASF
jgi:ribosomal protein S14